MLSREEKAILEFERSWGTAGPKDREIEAVLGLSAASYYDILGSLVLRRVTSDHDPLTVRRVLRLMEARPEEAAS